MPKIYQITKKDKAGDIINTGKIEIKNKPKYQQIYVFTEKCKYYI